MGILTGGRNKKPTSQTQFTKKELDFILAKLRTAQYRGDEFEMFYNVWVKVNNNIDSIKDEDQRAQ